MAEHGAGVAQAEVGVAKTVGAGERGALRLRHEQRGRAGPVAHPVQRHAEQVVLLRGVPQRHGLRVVGDEAFALGVLDGAQEVGGQVVHGVQLKSA